MRPEATMPRALLRTLAASTLLPQQFQLFQPIGGVRAMVSPTMSLNFFSAVPLAFVARNVPRCWPGSFNAPVISPVSAATCSPAGRPSTENSIGRSPVAGMRYRNGELGRTPKMEGLLMRGIGGVLGGAQLDPFRAGRNGVGWGHGPQ